MAEKHEKHKRPTAEQLDERLAIPLDTKRAIESLLKVDPKSKPAKRPRKI